MGSAGGIGKIEGSGQIKSPRRLGRGKLAGSDHSRFMLPQTTQSVNQPPPHQRARYDRGNDPPPYTHVSIYPMLCQHRISPTPTIARRAAATGLRQASMLHPLPVAFSSAVWIAPYSTITPGVRASRASAAAGQRDRLKRAAMVSMSVTDTPRRL